MSQEYASQEFDETQYDDEELELDDEEEEGFLDSIPRGRTGNYTTCEDILLCTAWKKISLDASVRTDQPSFTIGRGSRSFSMNETQVDLTAQPLPFASVGPPYPRIVSSGCVV